MSSSTVVSNPTNNVQIVTSDKSASSTITTTAKSSTTTVTASGKKSRKSEINSAEGGTNFLPIAPHQAFYSSNQGLTLASVQQQQLQSGSLVFSPQTMMTTLGTGPQGQQQGQPQTGQQLVVASGQAMTPTFNTANGQGLIQAGPGMNMLSGLPPLQMIHTGGGGQPTYTFQPVYTNQGMQQMLLNQNFAMAFQQNQGLAIQIPNGNAGNMITTNQLTANTPTTPVKNQASNQPIIKSVTISPQQPQATKSTVNNVSNANRVQPQQNQQQTSTIIQPTFSNQQNPTLFIGTFQNHNNQANNATIPIVPNTPTSARKNGAPGSNVIHKIQPATTTLTTSPIIAPAQFKSNTSFQTTTSPANGQTIMVHGQGIQSGTGGIQLGPNQTIISPLTSFPTLQSGLTWTSPINQQTTQLVGPGGQPIFFRTGQSGDQPHMLIQTSSNQFQAVPMQMAQGSQTQTANSATMQMTQTGQPLVTTSINQSLPIIQTNSVTQTAIMTQQANNTSGPGLLTSTTTSQNNTPTSATILNSRPRPLRPANNTQTTISTQTTVKQKISLDNRTSVGSVPKLAPKNATVNSTGLQVNALNRTALGPQPAKIPITLTKQNDNLNQASKSLPTTNTTLVSTASNKYVAAKVSTSTTTQITPTVMTSLSSTVTPIVTSLSNTNTLSTSTVTNLVSSTNIVQSTKVSSPVPPGSKLNRKIDKKDSTGVDSKSNSFSSAANKTAKTGTLNSNRNSTGTLVKTASTNTSTSTGHMINGVMCQMQPNSQLKTSITNGTVKSTISKTVIQNGLSTPKNKPKQAENPVLTHVIDGYVIQESPNPFPINGYANADLDNQNEKNSQTSDSLSKCDSKENLQNGQINQKSQDLSNSVGSKDNANLNGVAKSGAINEQQQPIIKTKLANATCLVCGNQNKFKKFKKCCSQACLDKYQKATSNKLVMNSQPQIHSLSPKPLGQPTIITNQSPILQVPLQLSVVNFPQGQPQLATNLQAAVTHVNGTNAGNKRLTPATPIEQTNIATPEKRAKMDSPVSIKSEPLPVINIPQNGVPDTSDSSNNDNKADITSSSIPELEGLWLPSGGKDPNKWTVQDVFEFISHLEGCSEFAEDFRSQEIDGQALMLLKEEHFIDILHMKLGPALKIFRKIKDLKSAFSI